MRFLAFVGLLVIGCTNESGSRRALEAMGFTDIRLEGFAFTGCSDSDSTCTQFTAKRGDMTVHGVVGCGLEGFPLSKGCTVRVE